MTRIKKQKPDDLKKNEDFLLIYYGPHKNNIGQHLSVHTSDRYLFPNRCGFASIKKHPIQLAWQITTKKKHTRSRIARMPARKEFFNLNAARKKPPTAKGFLRKNPGRLVQKREDGH